MKKLFTLLLCAAIQLPLFMPHAQAVGHTDYYPRPVPMGVSISTTPSSPFIFAGTAGMRVFLLGNPNTKLILSNNHVLGAIAPTLCPDTADQYPPPLTWALQPGTLDIGNDPGNDPFYLAGLVVRAVELRFGLGVTPNRVDAAVAYTTPALASSEILGIGQPNPALGFASIGMPLIKSGRTTGVTNGTVTAVNSTVFVNYGSGCGSALFSGQVMTTAGLGDSGDSGSVVLDSNTLTPVGLYFAGSATTGIMNPILEVYRALGVFVDSAAAPITMTKEQLDAAALAEKAGASAAMKRMKLIQARHEKRILSIPGVTGIGIGQTDNGQGLRFVVFAEKRTASVMSAMPQTLDGMPVHVVESGRLIAH